MITWPCCELTIHHLIHTWRSICIHSAFYIISCWLRVTHQLISSIIQTQQANDQGQPQRSLLRSGNHWCRWMVLAMSAVVGWAWKEQVVRSKGDKQVKQPQYLRTSKSGISLQATLHKSFLLGGWNLSFVRGKCLVQWCFCIVPKSFGQGLVYSQQSARTPEDFNTAIAGRIPPSGGPIGSDAIPLFELVQEQSGHRKFHALAFSFARKLQCLRHTHIYNMMPNFWIPSCNLRQLWNQAHARRFSFKNGSICSIISYVNDYQRVYIWTIPSLVAALIMAFSRPVSVAFSLRSPSKPCRWGDKAGDTPGAVGIQKWCCAPTGYTRIMWMERWRFKTLKSKYVFSID